MILFHSTKDHLRIGFCELRISNRRDFGNRRNPNHNLPEGSEENNENFSDYRSRKLDKGAAYLRSDCKVPSTLLVLARLVVVGRLVWLLLVLVNLRPHYFSCSPGFDA
jgi:hypothetical protein